jgi:hypothetical protein
MALLTKDNVMQARYLDAEQQDIMVLYIDFDADGKSRANYEIIIEAGSAQHKELHSAGWDHARIDTITLEYNISNQREVEEKVLGHEATKIIDERLQVTKDALAKAVEAFKETRKINDATKEKIAENAGELKERTKEVYLKRNKETARMIALYIYENNKDRECVDILAHMTSRKGYSLLEILAQCTPEGGAGPDNPIKDMGHDDLLKKELKWKTLDWK